LYSKKVLNHFQSPRNQGKIKNPDGVGQVGNPVCLLPQEMIFLDNQFEEIKKSHKGAYVLSHDGRERKITKRSSRDYNGEIIILKNNLGKVSLTPEHLIFAIKVPKHYNFLRTKNKQKLIPAWYHAEELQKGDMALYPIPQEIKEISSVKINIAKPKWDFKSKDIPCQIFLNDDFLRLSGYFLAEGSIQDKPCKTFIVFTLNIAEKEIVEDIKIMSEVLFGLEVKIREKQAHKTVEVFLYSARLARFFRNLFGEGAAHKRLPAFFMHLDPKKQRSLIFGLWKGDGYVNLNRIGPRAGYATISYQLAQQIKLLLLRQKIALSFYEEKAKSVKGVNHKKAYRIHIGQRDSLKKLCRILEIKYFPKSYEAIKLWFDKNYFYTAITGKKRLNYHGKVYNLEVGKAHSFISDAFCLHNCGDILKVYIKVKNNKISEIKFETLGCGAAIATSSMITELARGKTLEEAGKISREDIANELGGLPPVKMHCSNLAADALRKAIEDYKKRIKK